MSAEGL